MTAVLGKIYTLLPSVTSKFKGGQQSALLNIMEHLWGAQNSPLGCMRLRNQHTSLALLLLLVSVCAGSSPCIPSPRSDDAGACQWMHAAGSPLPPPRVLKGDGGKVTLLPLGDSLTKGAVNNKCSGRGGGCYGGTSYRLFLGEALQSSWGAGTFNFVGSRPSPNCARMVPGERCSRGDVEGPRCLACSLEWDLGHDGHRAWTTRDVLDGKGGREPGVREWLKKHELPDVVLLMIGTNDIFKGFAQPERAVQNLEGVLRVLRSANRHAVIMVMQIVPFGKGVKRWSRAGLTRANGAVGRYNALVARLVERMNAAAGGGVEGVPGYVLVRQAEGFDPGKHLMRDGVHPNEEGERVIARAWHRHLTPELADAILAHKLAAAGG